MKKKFLSIMLSVSVLATIFAGCGNSQSLETTETKSANEENIQNQDSQLESGKVELTVWTEEDNFEMMEKMLESFKQKYEGQAEFEITLAAQSDSKTKDVMLEDIHSAADVISLPDDQLLGMIAAGALSPVKNAQEVASANLAEAVAAASYKDTLFAYPYSADNGYFLYYDKNYLSESDVQTLDGILKIAEENDKKFSMELTSGWYLYAFFGQTGLEFGLNDDGITNYCNWNLAEGAIKGTDIAESLLEITSSPAFVSEGNGSLVDSIASGEVIAGIGGVWNAVAIRELWGDDYGACKLPTYTCAGQQVQMSSFTGYKMMGVNSYSKHLDWAHKLAEWLTNEENQTIRFEERSQGPSNIKAAASDAVNKVPAIAAVIEQSQYGNLQRVGGLYWDACDKFAQTILKGNPEGKPLQDIMDTLVTDITASTVK